MFKIGDIVYTTPGSNLMKIENITNNKVLVRWLDIYGNILRDWIRISELTRYRV